MCDLQMARARLPFNVLTAQVKGADITVGEEGGGVRHMSWVPVAV
jgi:hypothetical protein